MWITETIAGKFEVRIALERLVGNELAIDPEQSI